MIACRTLGFDFNPQGMTLNMMTLVLYSTDCHQASSVVTGLTVVLWYFRVNELWVE